jgi:multicomponent Na+:H+ antiporter subunit D
MNLLLALPILIPLVAAALSLTAWRSLRVQRVLAVSGTAALTAAGVWLFAETRSGVILVSQMGDWPAPFGVTLVADVFSAVMVLVTGVIGLTLAVYSLGSIDQRRETFGYYALMHILLAGVCGAFLTGDLFNLYVWFEVMLIASFVLMALGGEVDQLRGAIYYVTINLVSSAVFLAAVGIIYGATGSLNMADLAAKLAAEATRPALATTLGVMLLFTFGVKAAVFPLFFWLPASYHTPPAAVSALFAGLLTKVGVYALIRTFTLIFVHDTAYTHGLLLIVSGLTMLAGVMGAMVQSEMRRILSFHIISQIGYMVAGLALFGLTTDPNLRALALAAAVFYIVHHILVKTNLFLVSGVVDRLQGTFHLGPLGGLYRQRPGFSILFAVPAMALVGMPPLSGFFAKLAIIRVALALEQYVLVLVALVTSLLTMYSMTKIWNEAFWKEAPEGEGTIVPTSEDPEQGRLRPLMVGPIIALAAMTIAIGIGAEQVFDVAHQAGRQLAAPELYIEAVLGAKR